MDKHISSQFDAELAGVSSRVLELGGLVESQIRHAVVIARLDNLGKGASGAAVQNLNLMLSQIGR